jgi:hypothetical protein
MTRADVGHAIAGATGRLTDARSSASPRIVWSAASDKALLFRASAVGVAAGVQAGAVRLQSLEIPLPWQLPLGCISGELSLSLHRTIGRAQGAPRSIRIAPAPLNIATALHAEATRALSLRFWGRRTNNYSHHRFALGKSLGVRRLAFLGWARTGWTNLRWERGRRASAGASRPTVEMHRGASGAKEVHFATLNAPYAMQSVDVSGGEKVRADGFPARRSGLASTRSCTYVPCRDV